MQATPFSQQQKFDLINIIKATMMVLLGEDTLQNQAMFFGKYLPTAPRTNRPDRNYEFSFDQLFEVVFKKEDSQALDFVEIFLPNKIITRFNENYFSDRLQLDFSDFIGHNDSVSFDTYSYTWKLNKKIVVNFFIDPDNSNQESNYPQDFYHVTVTRVF